MKPSSALPKYIQISEMLIREAAAGRLPPGTKLPTEREMAADLGISVGTLRKALADMERKGLLERIQGSGNYIQAGSNLDSVYAFFRLEKIEGGGLPTAQVLSVDRLTKPADAPAFGASQEGHRIRRLRLLDDAVIALEEIWLDGSYRDTIAAADLSESLYLYYRKTLGLVIAMAEDRIGISVLPDWSPIDFPLPAGAPAGYIERLGKLGTGVTVEYSRTWFDSGKARYISRMGRG